MLRTLLLITSFLFIQNMAQATCIGCETNGFDNYWNKTELRNTDKPSFSVYPNPAIDYVTIADPSNLITEVTVYNLVGRKIKTFQKSKNDRYNISSLHKGLYLIQLRGADGQILTTQRVNKR